MTSRSEASWYVEDDLGRSVQNAKTTGISEERILRHLRVKTDFPKNRIRAVLNALDSELADEDGATVQLSQAPSTDASPRPSPSRRLGVNDIAYLSDREFARVLGFTLEQFDGNTVRPPTTETIEVDLFWNRAQITLGIRTVTATKGEVGENHVTPLLEGNTTSDVTRAPSYLAVVTNGTFSDEAEQTAQDNEIGLFDGGHLERWFRRTLLPLDAAGTVLEEGEDHDGPLNDLITFPTPPEPRCGVDPLELERAFEVQIETTDKDNKNSIQTDTAAAQTGRTPIPVSDEQPSPGEKGVLYADPNEDGDYQAFDDYLEEL